MRIDLREPLSAKIRSRLGDFGLEMPFAVITPCNPVERQIDETENARRYHAFVSQLSATGSAFVDAVGESPDGKHQERGVALRTTRDEAVRLAVAQEQSALFWYDGNSFWLIGALVQSTPTKLPAGGG